MTEHRANARAVLEPYKDRDAVRLPAVQPRRDIEARKGKQAELMPAGRFFEDTSAPALTNEMIREIIATTMDGGFYRTPAGYVSFTCGFDHDDNLLLTMTHWKSFTHPEADETLRVTIELGNIRS